MEILYYLIRTEAENLPWFSTDRRERIQVVEPFGIWISAFLQSGELGSTFLFLEVNKPSLTILHDDVSERWLRWIDDLLTLSLLQCPSQTRRPSFNYFTSEIELEYLDCNLFLFLEWLSADLE